MDYVYSWWLVQGLDPDPTTSLGGTPLIYLGLLFDLGYMIRDLPSLASWYLPLRTHGPPHGVLTVGPTNAIGDRSRVST